jgi:uncharacterized protein DUF6492
MHSMQVTLLTPTLADDFERFCLQRESIRRCGIEIPHVAVVNDEDMPKFADLPDRKNLTIISTRDVLPPMIEQRRQLWGASRKNWQRWFAGVPLSGWHCQQFIKLAAPSFIQTRGVVCLDSDTVFLRHVTDADFCDGNDWMHLYETTGDVDVEMAEWLGRSMRFLGINPQGKPLSRFTHAPVPMDRDILLEMQFFIARRHRREWHQVFDPVIKLVMEYSLYGVFAKYLGQARRVSPTAPPWSVYFWWPNEAEKIERDFTARTASPQAKILNVQSNAGVSPQTYRPLLEKFWDSVG